MLWWEYERYWFCSYLQCRTRSKFDFSYPLFCAARQIKTKSQGCRCGRKSLSQALQNPRGHRLTCCCRYLVPAGLIHTQCLQEQAGPAQPAPPPAPVASRATSPGAAPLWCWIPAAGYQTILNVMIQLCSWCVGFRWLKLKHSDPTFCV